MGLEVWRGRRCRRPTPLRHPSGHLKKPTRIPFCLPKTALCQNEKRSFPLKPPGLHPEAHTHSNEKKDIFEKDSHNITRTTTYLLLHEMLTKELTLRVS